jgi:hypothetical protein
MPSLTRIKFSAALRLCVKIQTSPNLSLGKDPPPFAYPSSMSLGSSAPVSESEVPMSSPPSELEAMKRAICSDPLDLTLKARYESLRFRIHGPKPWSKIVFLGVYGTARESLVARLCGPPSGLERFPGMVTCEGDRIHFSISENLDRFFCIAFAGPVYHDEIYECLLWNAEAVFTCDAIERELLYRLCQPIILDAVTLEDEMQKAFTRRGREPMPLQQVLRQTDYFAERDRLIAKIDEVLQSALSNRVADLFAGFQSECPESFPYFLAEHSSNPALLQKLGMKRTFNGSTL